MTRAHIIEMPACRRPLRDAVDRVEQVQHEPDRDEQPRTAAVGEPSPYVAPGRAAHPVADLPQQFVDCQPQVDHGVLQVNDHCSHG